MRFPTNGKIARYPSGVIIQGFGENPQIYAKFGEAGHDGLDILPDIGYGQDVYSPVTGTVVKIYYNGQGLGNQVHVLSDVINGKQLYTELGHLTDEQLVIEGQRVVEGQIIAHMGNSGFVVSGGVQAWGQSNPDKKGTHTHWNTRWVIQQNSPSNTSILGKNYLIENYNNGFYGFFNPLTLLGDNMNEAKIVKSKTSSTVYWCYPMPDLDYLQKKANLEGITIPTQIPDTDSLT